MAVDTRFKWGTWDVTGRVLGTQDLEPMALLYSVNIPCDLSLLIN